MIYRIANTDTQKFYSVNDGWVTKIEDSTALTSKEARLLVSVLEPYNQGSLVISLDKQGGYQL